MLKRPRLDPAIAARLNDMGLKVGLAYQPESHFIKNGRKLTHVAESGDPWSVTILRRNCVLWADGAQVGRALAATFEDAVEAAIPTGLLSSAMRLDHAVEELTEAIRACQN